MYLSIWGRTENMAISYHWELHAFSRNKVILNWDPNRFVWANLRQSFFVSAEPQPKCQASVRITAEKYMIKAALIKINK